LDAAVPFQNPDVIEKRKLVAGAAIYLTGALQKVGEIRRRIDRIALEGIGGAFAGVPLGHVPRLVARYVGAPVGETRGCGKFLVTGLGDGSAFQRSRVGLVVSRKRPVAKLVHVLTREGKTDAVDAAKAVHALAIFRQVTCRFVGLLGVNQWCRQGKQKKEDRHHHHHSKAELRLVFVLMLLSLCVTKDIFLQTGMLNSR